MGRPGSNGIAACLSIFVSNETQSSGALATLNAARVSLGQVVGWMSQIVAQTQ